MKFSDRHKEIIYKELCRRIPCSTMCYVPSYTKPLLLVGVGKLNKSFLFRLDNGELIESLFDPYNSDDVVKPYLRRTVFMSEEESLKVCLLRRNEWFYSFDTEESNEYIYYNHWDRGCEVESMLSMEAPIGMYR